MLERLKTCFANKTKKLKREREREREGVGGGRGGGGGEGDGADMQVRARDAYSQTYCLRRYADHILPFAQETDQKIFCLKLFANRIRDN